MNEEIIFLIGIILMNILFWTFIHIFDIKQTKLENKMELEKQVEQLEKENEELKYLIDDSNIIKAFIAEHNKAEQLENIRKEAIEYIKNDSYFDGSGICANDLLNILNKGE